MFYHPNMGEGRHIEWRKHRPLIRKRTPEIHPWSLWALEARSNESPLILKTILKKGWIFVWSDTRIQGPLSEMPGSHQFRSPHQGVCEWCPLGIRSLMSNQHIPENRTGERLVDRPNGVIEQRLDGLIFPSSIVHAASFSK